MFKIETVVMPWCWELEEERESEQLGAAAHFIAFGWVGGESWKNVGPCKNEEYYMNYK